MCATLLQANNYISLLILMHQSSPPHAPRMPSIPAGPNEPQDIERHISIRFNLLPQLMSTGSLICVQPSHKPLA